MRASKCAIRCVPALSSSNPSTVSFSSKPSIPLFLKPAKYSATLEDIQKWHSWATDMASSVGLSFVQMDNGPDAVLLKRELKWLLEDSLEKTLLPSQLPAVNEKVSQEVLLRVPLDNLYELWRERIVKRRPLQYLVGCEHWRDLVLGVQEGVLIPRPETELIIDLVEEAIASKGLGDGCWADLGTGSGAIAIGIARVLGSSGRVIATDLSSQAVHVASYNVQRYGLQEKIEIREGSWYEPLKDLEGKLVGIVSNPPYIPSDDIPSLQAEVGRHEPKLALDGGCSGVDSLQHLVDGAASMLKPGGFFAFETNGEKQCDYLTHCLENDRQGTFSCVKIVPDFSGIRRFITGFKSN